MADERKEYVCTSCPTELKAIRELVTSACKRYQLSQDDTCKVVLAIDEACANVIRHGYKNAKDGYLCIETYQQDGYGVFLIKDKCQSISEEVLQPKKEALLEPGGLGLHLIHEVMDSVALIPHSDSGNQLELKIKL